MKTFESVCIRKHLTCQDYLYKTFILSLLFHIFFFFFFFFVLKTAADTKNTKFIAIYRTSRHHSNKIQNCYHSKILAFSILKTI